MPLKTGQPFPKQHDVWLKPHKTVQPLWTRVKGMDLCSFPLIWSSCPLTHLIFESGDCITFHFTIFLCLLSSTKNSAPRDPVHLNTFMHSWHCMVAPESEAKEIMFEKRLLSLKGQTNIHKAKEGPKERTTINEIYLIFQMLFLDSNKIEFSTYQFIFSIKKRAS